MDSLNEYCPPQKRLKPMVGADSALERWDAVNANDLNAELPDELRDISSSGNGSDVRGQDAQTLCFQTDPDCHSMQLNQVDLRQADGKTQMISFPTVNQCLSSDSGIQLIFSGNFKPNELSNQIQFLTGSENVLLKYEDKSLVNTIGTTSLRDVQLNYAASLQPQEVVQVQQPLQILKTVPSLQTFSGCLPQKNVLSLSQASALISHSSWSQKSPPIESKQTNTQMDSSSNTLSQNRCLIQKQLILLLHANKCQKGKQSSQGSERLQCNIPQCQTMKDVLIHLSSCKENSSCTVPYCASSRQIIQHWKTCSNNQCAVCQPLRLACEKKNASLLSRTPQGNSVQAVATSIQHSQGNSKTSPMSTSSQQELSNALVPHVERNENWKGLTGTEKADWRQDFGKELRDTVVYKLMKCLYPSCGNLKLNELTGIILNMKKLETGAFEAATSKEEYYNMLSMKIQMVKGNPEKEVSTVLLQSDTSSSTHKDVDPLHPSGSIESLNRQAKASRMFYSNSGKAPGGEITSLMGPFKERHRQTSDETNLNTNVTSSIQAVNDSKEAVESLVGSSSDVGVTASSLKFLRKDELKSLLLPILVEIARVEPESLPFRQPVNPVLEGVPEYLEVIKKPMDLSTIRKKLEDGVYEEPRQFADDMWQMFENAWVFNKKGSRVHRYCTKLSEIFDPMMNILMKKLGYCCGHKYMYTPIVLVCYGKFMCTISINSVYYTYQNRFSYCEKCFNGYPDDFIELNEEPGQSATRLMKSHFVQMKNGEFEYEKLVDCSTCGRKQHAVCCMHLEQLGPNTLQCPSCPKDENIGRRIEEKFCAKKLPQTHLSSYLESRVNSFLRKSGCRSQEVIIRVLSSSEKCLEIKEGMRKMYERENKNDTVQFPYVSKAIFAFMEDEGIEVCFFGMHVHEYDSKCPQPNSRRVYIAYMDSVNFFHPRHLRTSVYHELLIGYLDYAKKLGYAHAHIWVCPPCEGDDYIFNCHPPNMKIPKQRRLQDWYKKLLDKALAENIIYDYKDLLKYIRERHVTSVTEIPYFDGDYWPSILEEFIREATVIDFQKCDEGDDGDCFEVDTEGSTKEKRCLKDNDSKKRRLRSRVGKKQLKRGSGEYADHIMARVLSTLEKLKEGFFVVNLHLPESERLLPEIKDPDQCILNDLMDGRDSFLALAREKHFEFSSLRRAKYSTLALLYELHTQGRTTFTYTCNSCKTVIDSHYHCSICPDFDLCEICYKSEGHIHAMEKLKEIDRKQEETTSLSTSNNRHAVLMRDMAILIHVFRCRSVTCPTTGCRRMKAVVQHVRSCTEKNDKTCPTCRHFLALCCCHAKRCNNSSCSIPLCDAIKQKFLLQKRLQNKLLKRRMASLRRDAGFSSEYENKAPPMSESRKNQTLANKTTPKRVDVETQHLLGSETFFENSLTTDSPKELVCEGSTSEHAVNLIGETSKVVSNSQHLNGPPQSVFLLVNSSLGTVQGSTQVLNTTANQPLVLQLQANHCLLTNSHGKVLGVVQMPVIQNQQLINLPQTSQIFTSVSSSKIISNITSVGKPQPSLNNAMSSPRFHFQATNNQGGFQEVQIGTSALPQQFIHRMESGAGAPVSRSSTSALQTLYKTLKSSPLPQHQQLLNILMSDPSKLAKVIKQKHANKGVASARPAEQSFNSAPAASLCHQMMPLTCITDSMASSMSIEPQPHNTGDLSGQVPKNEFADVSFLSQHSNNLTTDTADASQIFNSSSNQMPPMNISNFGGKDGAAKYIRFGNSQLTLNPVIQTDANPSTIIPSSLTLNDDEQHQQFILHSSRIHNSEKLLNSHQFQGLTRTVHANQNQILVKQQPLFEMFSSNVQKSQGSISSNSSHLLEKVQITKESSSHLKSCFGTNSPRAQIYDKFSNTTPDFHSTSLTSQSIIGQQASKTSVRNVMLSSQLPCILEIPHDDTGIMKQLELSQLEDSLQDQLSRFAEEL